MSSVDVTLDDIQRALDSVQDAFNDAPAEGGSIYDPPPDGEYEALVSELAFVGWEPKNGKPGGIGLKVNYQITNHSTYAGRITGEMYNITDPARIGYFKGWLNTMGVDVEGLNLSALRPEPGSILYSLLDVPVYVKVVRKGGYVNTYLQQRLGDAIDTGRSDVPGHQGQFGGVGDPIPAGNQYTPTDDDIPF